MTMAGLVESSGQRRVPSGDEVKPIDGADRIEQVIIGGWSVVVKKGEFHVGDYVVYIEIDAFLPVSNDLFSFLAPRGTRRMVHNGVE